MLTRAFTAGIMGAPEHLSRRDRVSFFNDHQAATILDARSCVARRQAMLP
jgi:hypothetical protein